MSVSDVTEYDYSCFTYTEIQDYLSELRELMSYAELTNISDGSTEMVVDEKLSIFNTLSREQKVSYIQRLMEELETTNENIRMKASHAILFIALGCMDVPMILEKVDRFSEENTILLFKLGVFPILVNLLNMERISTKYSDKPELHIASFPDSSHLCVLLNIVSLIVGQMLLQKKSEKYGQDVKIFIEESLSAQEEDSLLFILLDMMTEFALSEKPGYPIKKILLLIWKIIMISFGDIKDLCLQKQAKRIRCGLNNNHSNRLDINTEMYKFPFFQKVSTEDLDEYIHIMSLKHREMNTTIAAESIESLKKHLYVSLSELQVQENFQLRDEKIETLYENMLPKMAVYVRSLLQIFQSSVCSPIMNLYSDKDDEILPMSSYTSLMVLGKFQMFEHMEIMNKAISGILLLLLKHFKLNHIYQFEYICDEMVSCDAIPLMRTYIETASDIFVIFTKTLNQRNLYTCVNVLRILNKLLKGKYCRMVIFMGLNHKHLNSLASLNNKHLEVYSLKLLKILSKLLGRKWRQDNIKVMNKIFQNVRHRLLEDWNSIFQNNNDDEKLLEQKINFFNACYTDNKNGKYTEDAEIKVELTDYFKRNYERWLEEEVFKNPFDWDILLKL
ncbi:striatin-interacting protein 1-like [Harmonia axyridis]|uniref:striatin-interacting protein 1-like n=1 Tax=Harmonia axyridis TaxID=115357 RepID=UPI001E2753E6|nr:striatin-interacting protein 1-like [Harmonia axyridis]